MNSTGNEPETPKRDRVRFWLFSAAAIVIFLQLSLLFLLTFSVYSQNTGVGGWRFVNPQTTANQYGPFLSLLELGIAIFFLVRKKWWLAGAIIFVALIFFSPSFLIYIAGKISGFYPLRGFFYMMSL